MPTIRIDDEVYAALANQASGFVTPNDVLRRLLGLSQTPVSGSLSGRTRAGRHEYQVGGEWLRARDYLEVVEASGHEVARQYRRQFETALRGTGNGMSNLAKNVAGKLGHTTRTSG